MSDNGIMPAYSGVTPIHPVSSRYLLGYPYVLPGLVIDTGILSKFAQKTLGYTLGDRTFSIGAPICVLRYLHAQFVYCIELRSMLYVRSGRDGVA